MLGVWRKTHVPHQNRQRKTMQKQKANHLTNYLVAQPKPFHPHKEKNKKANL
jgi:hypothetical protein